ncbi:MAG TPA: hypothetical protein DCX80_01290 [Chloroflexi bacterium]|nr:hypothetical protein [Chloroflexota bacterium]
MKLVIGNPAIAKIDQQTDNSIHQSGQVRIAELLTIPCGNDESFFEIKERDLIEQIALDQGSKRRIDADDHRGLSFPSRASTTPSPTLQ